MELDTNDAPAFNSSSEITDAFAGADFGQEDPESTPPATPPADEEPAAEDEEDIEEGDDAPDEEPAREGDKPFNPEGPGNVKAALKQSRDEAKALKDTLAQTNARLAALENERQQQQLAYQQRQQAAQRQQVLEELHPDDVPAYLEQERQRDAQTLQQQAQWTRLADSAAATRRALPEGEFDAQLGKLTQVFGLDLVNQWAMRQEHPALAVYDAAKGFFTQSDLDAAKEAGRQEALQALPDRTQRKPASAPRLANLPAAGRTQDVAPVDRLTKRLSKGGDVSEVVSGLFAEAFKG